MLGNYYYSREELVDKIKKSPVTNDGYYFFPKFKDIVHKIGKKKDINYYFSRNLFTNKMVFSNSDIEAFLERDENDIDINEMIKKDDYLNAIIDEYVNLDIPINKELPDNMFSLGDLIDTSLFVYYNKYRF